MPGLPRKDLFDLPEGLIYLDGNSLGPLPKRAAARASLTICEEWGNGLIRSWNTAGWMTLPTRVGDQVAKLIGAPEGSITTGETLSLKLFQALGAALAMRPDRKTVLSDSGNFPSDLYMANGLIDLIGGGHVLKTPPPESVAESIDEGVAAVMLTHADYRSGRLHDMSEITRRAHDKGAVMIWDLAHSAGALPVEMEGCNAEFGVGCTYKFLNGGPGAPAFIYVRPDIVEEARPALPGWLGHAEPFAMETSYRPANSIERFRVGTPPIVQLAVLEEALTVWDEVELADIRRASIGLSELFIAEVGKRCPELSLVSPIDPNRRGSQVSFAFEHGYAAIQALISLGVIGDFRPPNIMRFGIAPLFLDDEDILAAAKAIEKVVVGELWRESRFRAFARVT